MTDQVDVIIVGAGIAGMAASIHLANAGLRVVCIEADPRDSNPVGESLDWSAPELLRQLGLPMEHLLEQYLATCKRHVVLKLRDGSQQEYVPGEWLGRPPYNVNLRTLHVDRRLLDKALREIVDRHGVTWLSDRVQQVEIEGQFVQAVVTEKGKRVASRWIIDASGSGASLLPRLFALPVYEYGPHKVAIWDYFSVPESVEGTTLHADAAGPQYMEWVWQIPIHAETISVGYVTTGDAIKEKRRQGMSIQEIFAAKLGDFADLRSLCPQVNKSSARTTSFR